MNQKKKVLVNIKISYTAFSKYYAKNKKIQLVFALKKVINLQIFKKSKIKVNNDKRFYYFYINNKSCHSLFAMQSFLKANKLIF